jgi:hypothetical protein
MVSAALLVVSIDARAADPGAPPALVIVADADPGPAIARASAALGVPASSISAKRLSDVLPMSQPVVIIGGKPEECTRSGSSTAAATHAALAAAESSVAYVEYDKAVGQLDEAAGDLRCLSEPADKATVSRIAYLRGVVLAAQGNAVQAQLAFAEARAADAAMKWDDDFAPDAIGLFEGAAAPGTATILVSPATAAAWVDGVPLTGALSVPAGTHLVQLGDPFETLQVRVDGGATLAFVRPAGVSSEILHHVEDPAKQAEIAAILAAAVGEGTTVYVDDGQRVWKTTSGDAHFTALAGGGTPVATLPTDPVEPSGGGGRRAAGLGMSVAGGVLLGAGTIGTGVSYRQAKHFEGEATTAAHDDENAAWDAAAGQYDTWRTRATIMSAVAFGGLAVAGGGVTLLALPVDAVPGPVGDGFGINFRVIR